jgi:predicted DNA-binding ribbon-helix-helix protein
MPGKRVQLDDETWASLRLLARDRMMTFQELADEAFADVLKKHGRPVDLRAALRKSAQAADAPEQGRAKRRKRKSSAKASRA